MCLSDNTVPLKDWLFNGLVKSSLGDLTHSNFWGSGLIHSDGCLAQGTEKEEWIRSWRKQINCTTNTAIFKQRTISKNLLTAPFEKRIKESPTWI